MSEEKRLAMGMREEMVQATWSMKVQYKEKENIYTVYTYNPVVMLDMDGIYHGIYVYVIHTSRRSSRVELT